LSVVSDEERRGNAVSFHKLSVGNEGAEVAVVADNVSR
jgi:hypothetical protein